MTTIVERDSSGPATVLVMFLVIALIALGVWFAYSRGVFGEKTTIIENNRTIENRTVENRTVERPDERHDAERPIEVPAR
jgi:hypothetical protein